MPQDKAHIKWTGVCFDCANADELADFYCELLGWSITASDGPGWVQLRDPQGGVGINIQAEKWYKPPTWPEQPHEQHKMMHLEIEVDDLEAAVATASTAGATKPPTQPPDRDSTRFRVMLDPAGHPFCLFVGGE